MNEDATVDIRAVVEIKKGQEITKSYVSSLETTQLRLVEIKYARRYRLTLHVDSGSLIEINSCSLVEFNSAG